MRKIVVLSFITLDGVMQAGGSPDEDTSGSFKYGGWCAPYLAETGEAADEFMAKHRKSADLLLGRKTFETFASFWPTHEELWPGVNDVTKYVVSTTLEKSDVSKSGWKNSALLKNVDDIKKLKSRKPSGSESPDIQVHGSANLAQTLFKHDLVDELLLITFPITLGTGKRLFSEGTIPAAFKLTDSLVTANGVIAAYYKRAGKVRTGAVGN